MAPIGCDLCPGRGPLLHRRSVAVISLLLEGVHQNSHHLQAASLTNRLCAGLSLALHVLPRLVEGCPSLPAPTQAEEEPYLSTTVQTLWPASPRERAARSRTRTAQRSQVPRRSGPRSHLKSQLHEDGNLLGLQRRHEAPRARPAKAWCLRELMRPRHSGRLEEAVH